MNILVVDDRQLAVNALLRMLGDIDAGYTCRGACSGESALACARECPPDVAFLDIEMPGMGGIDLAHALRKINEHVNIVFATAHGDYALEAHGMYVSGYLLKPISEQAVRDALAHLRYPVAAAQQDPPRPLIEVHCFGTFDIFRHGVPLRFSRRKSRELMAYFVDRRGARCTVGEIINVLWEDGVATDSRRAQVRNFISDMRQTLAAVGAQDVIVRERDAIAVAPDLIDCDYYCYLRGSDAGEVQYRGEYMAQYSWAEHTRGLLERTAVARER